jgi:hypothetical protein
MGEGRPGMHGTREEKGMNRRYLPLFHDANSEWAFLEMERQGYWISLDRYPVSGPKLGRKLL